MSDGKTVRLIRERDLIDPMTGRKEWNVLSSTDDPDSAISNTCSPADRVRPTTSTRCTRPRPPWRSTERRITTNGEHGTMNDEHGTWNDPQSKPLCRRRSRSAFRASAFTFEQRLHADRADRRRHRSSACWPGWPSSTSKFAQRKAREAALMDNLATMRKAIDNFYADKQRYPSDLDELVPNYLRKSPGPDDQTDRLGR